MLTNFVCFAKVTVRCVKESCISIIRGKEEQRLFELVKPNTRFQMMPMAPYNETTPVIILVPMYGYSEISTHLNYFEVLLHNDPFVSLHLTLIYR